jgi:hypothetical protein
MFGNWYCFLYAILLHIIELVTDVHVLKSELSSSSIHICYVLMFGVAFYMLYCFFLETRRRTAPHYILSRTK